MTRKESPPIGTQRHALQHAASQLPVACNASPCAAAGWQPKGDLAVDFLQKQPRGFWNCSGAQIETGKRDAPLPRWGICVTPPWSSSIASDRTYRVHVG